MTSPRHSCWTAVRRWVSTAAGSSSWNWLVRTRFRQAMTFARERHGFFVFTGNTRHRVEVQCLKDFEDPRFVPPSTAGLHDGRVHPTRRAAAPSDEPTARAAVRAASAHRHRRRPDLRRGLRGPLRVGRRGARGRRGQRRRRLHLLRRRRTDPGRPAAGSVRTSPFPTHSARGGASAGVGPCPSRARRGVTRTDRGEHDHRYLLRQRQ